MTFRLLVPLIAAFFFFLYLAYLNPWQVAFVYAPGRSMQIPFAVLLLLAFFAGAFVLGIFHILSSVGNYMEGVWESLRQKKLGRIEKRLKEASDLAGAGSAQKALKSLEKVLSKDPKNLEALLLKGNLLREMRLYKEALDAHSLALAFHPSNLEAIFNVKDDYISAGQLDAAYNMLERIRGRKPKDVEIMTQMREISERQGDLKRSIVLQREVLKHLKGEIKIIEERHKLAELYCANAKLLLKEEDSEAAKKELLSAAKVSPGFLPAATMLGQIAMVESRPQEAEKILKNEFKQTHSIALLQRLEEIYRRAGEGEKIGKLYQWGTSVMNNEPDGLYLLLFSVMNQIENGDFVGAERTLNKANVHFSGTTLYNLARGAIEMGNAGEKSPSAAAFKKALEIEWARFLRYRCKRCGHDSRDYFEECPSCGSWDSALPEFK